MLQRLAALALWCAAACNTARAYDRPFAIEIEDDRTGRGVPMVELETVSGLKYITDSAGVVAFDEPGLMNQRVFFTIKSHGYEFPKDMFGYHGTAIDIKPGGHEKIKLKRINIAERLYRVTGGGIYSDTVKLGRKPPIDEPLLNGKVFGQDSVQATVYNGKIHWFWGDTNRPAYPLGNFRTSGATSELPGKGGLDPSVGVNLRYLVDDEGFSRKMIPLPDHEQGPVWIDGLLVTQDSKGKERLLTHFIRVKDLGTVLSRGLAVFNDEKQVFEKVADLPIEAPLSPAGHPTPVRVDGIEYFYFPAPYPNIRARADYPTILHTHDYEGYTPLVKRARFEKAATKIERTADGRLIWGWKQNTPPLKSDEVKELIDSGLLKAEECPHWLRDMDSRDGAPVLLHNGSFHWNEYRKKWVMVGVQGRGTSFLGEVWYAEADNIEGPWRDARKIVTHDKYSFYNPAHHPFFDQQGGRFIYFEGTFSNTFSGTATTTPRYEYNQIMYRLDLSDERLHRR